MKNSRLRVVATLVALQLASSAVLHARDTTPLPPAQLYGELFDRVQKARLFPDSKTFADAVARSSPEEIMRDYQAQKDVAAFSLEKFVAAHFIIPGAAQNEFKTAPREEIRAHIARLWEALSREPSDSAGADSQLVLATRYVVPGGRFREMYYWDSYFTMVGLQASGRDDLVADMVENFSRLLDQYGHIPNGTRTYYLSRSQPPFFAAMVELQSQRGSKSEGELALVRRLPQLQIEHDFWMEGASGVAAGEARRRVVHLRDGSLLNRYWDDSATPRPEAWVEDIETARGSTRPKEEVYRDLRASAESGWDFSSRWFADGKTLNTIRTTDIVPVDLNSLLYQLETTIARACQAAKRPDCQRDMHAQAAARQRAIGKLLWDAERGAFVDYDWRNGRRLTQVTLATAYPLFAGAADQPQGQRVARTLRETLLMPHGLATTLVDTGQQWDQPNGWAPLQWVAIDGLRKYGENELAATVAERWVAENARVYCQTGKLVEKYNVRDAGEGAGGEYPVQDGFGWTNAVLVKLLAIYPQLARKRYEYTGGDCAAAGHDD
ncbi:MAG TPA: alpha,alpha-trehalase TreF [Steroidobacteraceae bacterium]|nr:alpha,alpha-trehalase TreF [Steroidobacteraceae bacterium]